MLVGDKNVHRINIHEGNSVEMPFSTPNIVQSIYVTLLFPIGFVCKEIMAGRQSQKPDIYKWLADFKTHEGKCPSGCDHLLSMRQGFNENVHYT
jgi:hypothetical protein